MASPNHSMIVRALIVLLVLVAAATGGYFLLRPQPTMPIVGVVRSTMVRSSATDVERVPYVPSYEVPPAPYEQRT